MRSFPGNIDPCPEVTLIEEGEEHAVVRFTVASEGVEQIAVLVALSRSSTGKEWQIVSVERD